MPKPRERLSEERRAGEAGERRTVSGTSKNAGKLAWVCSHLELTDLDTCHRESRQRHSRKGDGRGSGKRKDTVPRKACVVEVEVELASHF